MVRRAEMQHVELVDDDAPDDARPAVPPSTGGRWAGADGRTEADGPDGGPPTGAEPAVRRRNPFGRRGALALAGVAAVTVLGLVAAQGVMDWRERVRRAGWADLPGVVDPIGEQLSVAWKLDPEFARGTLAFPSLGTRILSVMVHEDGSVEAVSLDLASGEDVWRAPLLPAEAARAHSQDEYVSGPGCDLAEHSAGDGVVACLVSDGFDHSDDEGTFTRVPATSARLVVLDDATGEQVLARDTPVAQTIAAEDDLLVTGGVEGEDVVVRGFDLTSGDERWLHRHPLSGAAYYDPATTPPVSVMLAGGAVGVTDPDGTLRVLRGADGSLDDEFASGGYGMGTTELRGGAAYVTTHRGGKEVTVLLRDGQPDVELEGNLVPPSVDDGSVDDLAITSTSAGMTAWDLRTGEKRWTAPGGYAWGATIVLGDVVYAATEKHAVMAVDAYDGTVRWSVPNEPGRYGGTLFTDGSRLFQVSEGDPGADGQPTPSLEAYSFEGEELGEVHLPDGVQGLGTFAPIVVAWFEDWQTVGVLR